MSEHTDQQLNTEEAAGPEAVTARVREPWGVRHRRAVEVCSLLVTVAFLSGAGVGMVAGYRPLLERAGDLSGRPARLEIAWPPLAGLATSEPAEPGGEPRTWANADIRASIETLARRELSDDPFDGRGLSRAREALLATGWFMNDLRLVRSGTGTVRVTGTWRAPIAAVRFAGEDHLVSARGELLPMAYPQDGSGMRVVMGTGQPMPEPGAPWPGGEVQEALNLLTFLRGMPGAEQIAGVDVSEFGKGRTLVLVTERGNRIIWGAPPGEHSPGQAQSLTKAQRLVQLHRAYGRIDAGRSLVDIRTEPVPILVEPAEVERAAPAHARNAKPTEPGDRRAAAQR